MVKTFKVKIVSCRYSNVLYASRIGQVFEVTMSSDMRYSPTCYQVVENGTRKAHYIIKDDCERQLKIG